MACCHHYATAEGGDAVFSVDVSAISFGPGALAEVGASARELGMRRAAVFTDPQIAELPFLQTVLASCRAAGVEVALFSESRVEPTDASFQAAAAFAQEAFSASGGVDGFISVGGGSVIDTAKAANLYATYPAEFLDYVNAPLGAGRPVPGALKPHIACPTTAGTGSECTGIAIFDLKAQGVKTGIAHRALRPARAVIDPTVMASLPQSVVAAAGFDVLSHALESFTAIPHSRRAAAASPGARPMSQGANPWSDVGCREALRLTGRYLQRAVADAGDIEARENMMFAATLAGIAFGNAGVHIPHGMSYSVAGLVRDFYPPGYPDDHPMCPHGMSVIVNAPAAFRFTASACPQRHIEGAELLGAEVRGATAEDAGEVIAARLTELMRATAMPNGVGGVGYGEADIDALAAGASAQQRLLGNAPCDVGEAELRDLYRAAMRYW